MPDIREQLLREMGGGPPAGRMGLGKDVAHEDFDRARGGQGFAHAVDEEGSQYAEVEVGRA